MPATVKEVRKLFADRFSFCEEEISVYIRRAREIGLIPQGKAGRGDDCSAKLDGAGCLVLLLSILSGAPPKQAPYEALSFACATMTYGELEATAQEGKAPEVRRTAWRGEAVDLWAELSNSLVRLRASDSLHGLAAIQLSHSGRSRLATLVSVTPAGVCRAYFTTGATLSATGLDLTPSMAFIASRSVGADILETLAAMLGPLEEATIERGEQWRLWETRANQLRAEYAEKVPL
jgi:hypothetical protein